MNDRELLKKLNNLKEIKPDNAWKKSYREILYSQISAGRESAEPKSNIKIIWENIRPRQILVNSVKPVWLTLIVSIVIMVVGIGGVYGSKNSKPGDSLYIAKIISEKAEFAVTFNEKDRAKLNIEFATNRAKEMIEVLRDTDQTAAANNDKLEKLSKDFKKEISQVKIRLPIIKMTEEQAKAKETEFEVFGANLGKSGQRMEIAEPVKSAAPTEKASTSEPLVKEPAEINATSTAEAAGQAGKMLEEAEKLVDEKNIDGAINKLEEVSKAIDEGQVKGASETASSTD